MCTIHGFSYILRYVQPSPQFRILLLPQKEIFHSLATTPLPTSSLATNLLSISIDFPIVDFHMNEIV